MPQAVSKKQWRFMQAIMHGRYDPAKGGHRGAPPKGVAQKYSEPDSEAPDSKDNNRGGNWTEEHHAAYNAGVSYREWKKRKEKKDKEKKHKERKRLKKSFEEFYKGKGRFAAALVMDNENNILLGTHNRGGLAFPGGSIEPNESFEDAALREMNEESKAVGRLSGKIWSGTSDGNDGVVYLAEIVAGKPRDTEEIKNWKWYGLDEIPWNKLRTCCVKPLKEFVQNRFGKSIRGMVSLEVLEKANRKDEDIVEIDGKHASKLVGIGVYRLLKKEVGKMEDESLKDISFDTHKISIRKHTDGTYSGRVSDGHKVVYQYTNKTLHELAANLMSLFEWFLPEDEDVLEVLSDEGISDDAVHGGLLHLIDNYKRHNLGEIYQEMETIRQQIRDGMAVDLQQVEAKILKLFDKLEQVTHTIVDKHNKLSDEVGEDLDELEKKLRELQAKIDAVPKSTTIEAYSSNPANTEKVHDRLYSYLSKPKVEIQPSGKITISFGDDWDPLEQTNFLEDMRAKVIAKKKGK